jgi:AraC-like DNA-binding protein
MSNIAFEKHYRVKELARLWGLSPKTITRTFEEEAGVVRIANEGTGKRKYATLSIPESVALRVHERLGNQSLQPALAGGHPLRVVRLRDLHAGVPKQTRHILKRNTLQEHPHGECVP